VRRVLVAVLPLVAGVVAAVAWLAADRRLSREAFPAYSVHNTGPEGLSLAHAYLQARRPDGAVGTLARDVARAGLEADAVLLRVAPEVPPWEAYAAGPAEAGAEEEAAADEAPRPLLTEAERAWVEGGGRLVLFVGPAAYGPLAVEPGAADPVEVAFPLWPGVRDLEPAGARALAGPDLRRAVTVLARGERVAGARWALGRGEVVALAIPSVLQNARLERGDHLALLEAVAGEGRPVYFDELLHGLRDDPGLVSYVVDVGLGPLLLLALLAWAAGAWRGGARLGPPDREPEEARSEAVDLVDSLAVLYAGALSRREALALYAQALEREVGLRTGLRGEGLAARVRELAGGDPAPAARGTGDLGRAELAEGLRRINEAFRRLDHGRESGGRRVASGPRAA